MAIKIVTLPVVTCSSSNVAYPLLASGHLQMTSLTLQASNSNVGSVYVGDSSVTTANGAEIAPGDTCQIAADSGGRLATEEFFAEECYVVSGTGGNTVKLIGFARRI